MRVNKKFVKKERNISKTQSLTASKKNRYKKNIKNYVHSIHMRHVRVHTHTLTVSKLH